MGISISGEYGDSKLDALEQSIMYQKEANELKETA